MDDEDRLFMTNPLKALFIQNKEILGLLKRITQELDDNDNLENDDNLGEDIGFLDGENFDGN